MPVSMISSTLDGNEEDLLTELTTKTDRPWSLRTVVGTGTEVEHWVREFPDQNQSGVRPQMRKTAAPCPWGQQDLC